MNSFETKQIVFTTMGFWFEIYSETSYINSGDHLLIKVYDYESCDSYRPYCPEDKLPNDALITIERMVYKHPSNIAKEAHKIVFNKIKNLLKHDFTRSVFYEG